MVRLAGILLELVADYVVDRGLRSAWRLVTGKFRRREKIAA